MEHKYIKYKSKYLELKNNNIIQTGGDSSKFLNIVILHHPITKTAKLQQDMKPFIKKLSKFGKIHNYWFNFSKDNFELDDLLFENVALDIYNTFRKLKSFLIIALEHACPFGLYYSYHYPKTCQAIICYPFRYYSKGSYERRFWKLKENGGYSKIIKKYDVDNYMININNDRLQTLINDNSDSGIQALWYVIDFNMQKQYNKIPFKFKVPTIIYTRLDLDVKTIVEHNYDRTDIASMKQIFSENDAMQQSMMWNFERVKYDAMLKDNNKKLLKIKYLISGWEDKQDIINEVILFKSDV
jgi:hypothetical protein